MASNYGQDDVASVGEGVAASASHGIRKQKDRDHAVSVGEVSSVGISVAVSAERASPSAQGEVMVAAWSSRAWGAVRVGGDSAVVGRRSCQVKRGALASVVGEERCRRQRVGAISACVGLGVAARVGHRQQRCEHLHGRGAAVCPGSVSPPLCGVVPRQGR